MFLHMCIMPKIYMFWCKFCHPICQVHAVFLESISTQSNVNSLVFTECDQKAQQPEKALGECPDAPPPCRLSLEVAIPMAVFLHCALAPAHTNGWNGGLRLLQWESMGFLLRLFSPHLPVPWSSLRLPGTCGCLDRPY